MSRRVFLHIGAPKTGTTYLQERLARNTRTMARAGVSFPSRLPGGNPAPFHFRAALDLLDQDWGGPPGHATGAWDQLIRKVRRGSGDVLISHEILAPASADKVARVMRDLGGLDVHLVYTARDLARQVPAGWQESVKQGQTWRYRKYLTRMVNGKAWFARAFDLPTVLETWGADLPRENIHVVTVPPSGAPRDALWLRFCRTIGLDPAAAPLDTDRANESMGVVETEVLRMLNRRLVDRSVRRRELEIDQFLGRLLDEGAFVGESRRLVLPPERFDWAAGEAERWITWLHTSGVDVVGDAEELRPLPVGDVPVVDPDRLKSRRMLRASLQILERVASEAAQRPDPDQRLGARVRSRFGRD